MKLTIWYVIIDGGDGSYGITFFPNEKEAKLFEKIEEDSMGYVVDEGLGSHTFEVDEDGNFPFDFHYKDSRHSDYVDG